MAIGIVTVPGLFVPGVPLGGVLAVPADVGTGVDTARTTATTSTAIDTAAAVDTARALFNTGPFNGPRVATVMPETRLTQVAKDTIDG